MAITINGSGTVTGLSVGGLPDGTVDSGTLATDSVTAVKIPDTVESSLKSGRKNLIINGDFKVSQRGDYTSATTTTSGYDLDRWVTSVAGVTATLQQVVTPSLPAGESEYSDSVKVSATSTATGSIGVVQKLEDDTVLGGRTFTLSAWIKSNHAKAYLYLYEGNDGVYHYSSTHSGGGDWEKITVTGTLATGSTDVRVYAKIQSGSDSNTSIISGDYIEISQVQLELGSVATDFEHRSFGEELALCQRYYEEMYLPNAVPVTVGQGYNTRKRIGPFNFLVQKRVTPSIPAAYVDIDGGDSSHYFTFPASTTVAVGKSTDNVANIGGYDIAGQYGLTLKIDAEL